MVATGNRAGTQFHVEKSQSVGLRILANFPPLVAMSQAGTPVVAVERVDRPCRMTTCMPCARPPTPQSSRGAASAGSTRRAARALESYFRGVLLMPERLLFTARLDGVIVGCAQLVRPPRNNEAQAFAATLMHSFIAPYARGHGLGDASMTRRVEDAARALGYPGAELGRARDAGAGDQDVREPRLPALG